MGRITAMDNPATAYGLLFIINLLALGVIVLTGNTDKVPKGVEIIIMVFTAVSGSLFVIFATMGGKAFP